MLGSSPHLVPHKSTPVKHSAPCVPSPERDPIHSSRELASTACSAPFLGIFRILFSPHEADGPFSCSATIQSRARRDIILKITITRELATALPRSARLPLINVKVKTYFYLYNLLIVIRFRT